jgi:hypothetical protein
MKKAFVIVRVSAEDQLKGYGPDVQCEDDILAVAPLIGLEVREISSHYTRIRDRLGTVQIRGSC